MVSALFTCGRQGMAAATMTLATVMGTLQAYTRCLLAPVPTMVKALGIVKRVRLRWLLR